MNEVEVGWKKNEFVFRLSRSLAKYCMLNPPPVPNGQSDFGVLSIFWRGLLFDCVM